MRALRRVLAAVLSAATAAGALVVVGLASAPTAAAVTGSQWNAGSIISDSVFYDFGAMNAGQVQGFLDDKGSGCRAANDLPCLRDYGQATPSRSPENGLCSGYTGSGNESAASIIVNVARTCRINPRSLLVLLEKESSLVTRTTPSATAYRSATGYGCPDTAACDSTYYGFFNQVYMAARQFKVYALNPTRYGYQAGRVNSILYHPNASCGRGNVYIANEATAGLYTYTPYQPNGPALNNLYGTGDGCSAYGNRNFWRIFSDWFGDTQTGSHLLRTAADPTVYLVSGQTRYAVADLATLGSLAPLGSVGVVSADYLSGFTSGRTLGRFVRGPDGAVYLVDSGVLHQAPTCAMIADYGDDCPATVLLTSTQIAVFAKSSALTQVVSTTSGKTFALSRGTKREAFDSLSVNQAGLAGPQAVLDEGALATRPYGAPIVRDDVLAVSRSDASVWLSRGGNFTNVPRTINAQNTWARSLTPALLDPQSINAVPHDVAYTGLVRSVDARRYYVITPTGRRDLPSSPGWTGAYATFSDTLLGRLPDEGPITGDLYVKGATSPTVLLASGSAARPVTTYDAFVALGGGSAPSIATVADSAAEGLPRGAALLQPGGLVLDPTSGAVSLVDGTTAVVHLPSFPTAAALGLPSVLTRVDPSLLAAYPTAGADLSTVVRCGGSTYLGREGVLQRTGSLDSTLVPVTALGTLTCATLRLTAGATISGEVFVIVEGGPTVYRVTGTSKQPVSSWVRLLELTGGRAPVIARLGPRLLDTVPTGPGV